MSRWITLRTTYKLIGSDQFNHLRTRQQIDKMLRDTKAIARWEPHGIITHNYLSLYKLFLLYDTILLLECLSLLYKILTRSQYKDIPLKVKKLFSFLYACVLFTKNVQ